MSTLIQRAYRLVEAAARFAPTREGKSRIDDVHLNGAGYAEPGYSGEVIAFADWNVCSRYDRGSASRVDVDDTPKRLCEALERLGVAIEWSDEWSDCDECGKAVRTSPDSYGWTRSFAESDGDLRCRECLAEDAAGHLESLEGNPRTANTIDSIDPADHGYVRLDETFETGFHPGQDARPVKVAKWLEARGISRFLFQIDDVGQFDSKWSAWVHESEVELLKGEEPTHADADGPSISAAAERGLQAASVAMGNLTGEGIRVATVNVEDGTATAKLVSREDFIAGKALDEDTSD